MERKSIRSYGLFVTIVLTMAGVSFFSYPKDACNTAGHMGWIMPLICGAAAAIMVMVICRIEELNGYRSFVTTVKRCFGRILGYAVFILFIVYLIFALSENMRDFVEVIKLYLLPKTPPSFIILTIISLGIYMAGFGFQDIMKLNEVLFFLIFIPMAIAFVFLTPSAEFSNLFPFEKVGIMSIADGLYKGILAFGGYEILFLAFPFMKKKRSIKKISLYAVAFITIFYFLITAYCIACLSVGESRSLLWPGITMASSINVPGNFIERWEGLVMVLWILFYFTTFTALQYFLSYLSCEVLKIKKARVSACIVSAAIYALSIMMIKDGWWRYIVSFIIGPVSVSSIIAVPIIMLIISYVKYGRRRRKDEA